MSKPPAACTQVRRFISALLRFTYPAQDVLKEATTSTFKELGAYVKGQHLEGVNAAFGKRRLVPTALAVAGSMNSADHAGTFSALVAYLREQVTPQHYPQGA